MTRHQFKKGQQVKIFKGGKLEGTATIKAPLYGHDDLYRVEFEDEPGTRYDRWVSPEWQDPRFEVIP